MQNEQQIKKYTEVYNALNKEQKVAVDTIDGPVMVIAGPGTGKTQILGSRIGKILLEPDTSPHNILCLTYTDAGVVAMRKRLLSFIGAAAYKVNICTFHAFCNTVIQDNLSLFQKNVLEPISDLECIELFKKLIDQFPKGHPLKRYRGDVYFEIYPLQTLFATLKKEGFVIDEIYTAIEHYISNLATTDGFFYKRKYKQFNAGDIKQNLIDAEIEKADKLKAALAEFENYTQLMQQHNRYDYNDMINWVIKAFEENKNLVAEYQEQFLYILVDEFQDTSGTQNQIISLLINYWDKPNVFVVGDGDQSIFRFQGANIANMQTFATTYSKDLTTVTLTQNYRSTQPILDIAKAVIDYNHDRLTEEPENSNKTLTAANTKINKNTEQPILLCYDTQQDEMIATTIAVEALVNSGVPTAKIAIIYKENKYGEELAKYLQLKNIPYYSKRNLNLFELPLARKIIRVLEYITTELDVPYSGDEILFEILHYDWFTIKPIDIAKYTIEVANARYQKGAHIQSIRELLVEKAAAQPKDLFDTGTDPEIIKISNAIEKLIKEVHNTTLQSFFEILLNELGILKYAMQNGDTYWNLQIITGLFDLVKEETHRNPSLQLYQLISMLHTMQEQDLKLPLHQINGNDKGVNLLTCHGCKGLEFAHVFVVGVNAQIWEGKRKKTDAFNLAKYMQLNLTELKADIDYDLEELRRLFYVAITRAEQHLTISYFKYKQDAKEVEPSRFIAEIQQKINIPTIETTISKEQKAAFLILEISNTAKPIIASMEQDVIARSLDKFVMNVTALNAYLNCPLSFYYKNLIRIPSPKNENTEFGSAVHSALQQLFSKMLNTNEFPAKEIFIKDFERYMHQHRESFTKEQFKKRMEYGPMILSDYYDKYINNFEKIVSIERRISNVQIKGVPIKGAIDKIEFDGNYVNVIDYKTGDYEKAKKIKKQFDAPNEKNENGGDYWRQAVFYKILIDNYELKNWKVISTEFDFIEPNKQKEYFKQKIIITPEDITTVTQQIVTVWNKIQAKDFYTGCGKPECHWCNFVKDNNLAIDHEEENGEDEIELFKSPLE